MFPWNIIFTNHHKEFSTISSDTLVVNLFLVFVSTVTGSDEEAAPPVNGVSSRPSTSTSIIEEPVSSLIANSIKEEYEIEELGLDELTRPNSNAIANLVRVTEDAVITTSDDETVKVNIYKLESPVVSFVII